MTKRHYTITMQPGETPVSPRGSQIDMSGMVLWRLFGEVVERLGDLRAVVRITGQKNTEAMCN